MEEILEEQSTTQYWKEERWGYKIYQNEQKQVLFSLFWPRPPYTLNDFLRTVDTLYLELARD